MAQAVSLLLFPVQEGRKGPERADSGRGDRQVAILNRPGI